jgi:hypothetical protein
MPEMAQAASGMEARILTRLSNGTGEPVAPMQREKSQAAKTVRTRVPMRSTGTEQPIVVMKVL